MKTSASQLGYELTRGAIRAVGTMFMWGVIIVLLVNALLNVTGWRSFDATDDAAHGERSGMRIYTDHGTGCQYLATRGGELTARLDAQAHPICGVSR